MKTDLVGIHDTNNLSDCIKKKLQDSIDFENSRPIGSILRKPRRMFLADKREIQLLHLYKVSDDFVLGIYQGTLSTYDMLVRYWEKENGQWTLPRTPKHIHWTVDVLIKQSHDRENVGRFLDSLINDWDTPGVISPLTSKQQRDDFLDPSTLLATVFTEAEKYRGAQLYGEYPYEFLILLARILMTQERTNLSRAFMFRNLLGVLRDGTDIFKAVQTATYNGR